MNICDAVIVPLLLVIFETALGTHIYQNLRKKANVIHIHKIDSKNLLKNYRPISPLPICGKIFEKCIYNAIDSYFENNNLFCPYESRFRKLDYCLS